MTRSEILRAAKARLTPETWGGLGGQLGHGTDCASIAICRASGNWEESKASRLLAQVMTGRRDASHRDIYRWNDADGRTLAEVHAAFDAAIAIAEAKEGVITSELEYAEA